MFVADAGLEKFICREGGVRGLPRDGERRAAGMGSSAGAPAGGIGQFGGGCPTGHLLDDNILFSSIKGRKQPPWTPQDVVRKPRSGSFDPRREFTAAPRRGTTVKRASSGAHQQYDK